ncbi:unnamed protein product [Spirodela intermedia]|uniref:Uncharacterized protein n=1 Tax=Spirodela intermedia TaxID=51605 RepID=A0A7I8K100_SPIIN|nr:unnamed protein product [Spirodela intermedia]
MQRVDIKRPRTRPFFGGARVRCRTRAACGAGARGRRAGRARARATCGARPRAARGQGPRAKGQGPRAKGQWPRALFRQPATGNLPRPARRGGGEGRDESVRLVCKGFCPPPDRNNTPGRTRRRFRRRGCAPDTGPWEPRGLLLRDGNWAAGRGAAASWDSDLEAFSRNPTHVLSRLFDARGRPPPRPPARASRARRGRAAGAAPGPSPGRHAATRSHRASSSSSPPAADGLGTGTPGPSPQSQSFSRGYGSILPTSLAYILPSTRGCSPWRPDAVMSTTGRGRHSVLQIFKGRRGRAGRRATCGALPAAGPYLRLSHFQGGRAVKQKR